ncbi:centrosomal protein [Planoprotostelium fungivorum]|uniref:Centrosomal protein n=1 Tax=Planoprotostelium fungivorum TaxID=1890364 RepID=A0A2P6N0H3_9EUKA|nr:centrosomal protein [Planoprotostelium fungivorum]
MTDLARREPPRSAASSTRKYQTVSHTIDTGQSVNEAKRLAEAKTYSEAVAIQNSIKKDEIFKRIRCSTLIKWIESKGYDPSEDNLSGSLREQLRLTSPPPSRPDTALDLLQTASAPAESSLQSPVIGSTETFLLLDVRREEQFADCKIRTALSYPSAMLARSTNEFIREIYTFRNREGRYIIVYDEDESIASRVATTMIQKGIDNVYLLSGGLTEMIQVGPYHVLGQLSKEPLSRTSTAHSTAMKTKVLPPVRNSPPPSRHSSANSRHVQRMESNYFVLCILSSHASLHDLSWLRASERPTRRWTEATERRLCCHRATFNATEGKESPKVPVLRKLRFISEGTETTELDTRQPHKMTIEVHSFVFAHHHHAHEHPCMEQMYCHNCMTTDTPQWRTGWESKTSGGLVPLCNACGLRYYKKQFCRHCQYIYSKTEQSKSFGSWLTCTDCSRLVHLTCENEKGSDTSSISLSTWSYKCQDCTQPKVNKSKMKRTWPISQRAQPASKTSPTFTEITRPEKRRKMVEDVDCIKLSVNFLLN